MAEPLKKRDLKELLLADDARIDALTPPRQVHRCRVPPDFE